MSIRWILLCLACSIAIAPARAAIERVVEEVFPAEPGAMLKIDAAQGSIRVQPAERNEIRVIVREIFTAATEAGADVQKREFDLQMKQSGGSVVVTQRYQRAMHWIWQKWPPVAFTYEIHVPRSCSLELRTQEGDITVGSLSGSVQVQTGRGAIFVGETEGTVTALSGGRGDVAVTACTGDLTLSAKAGNVLVGRAGGFTKIEGIGGTIEVQNARGRVEVVGNNADVNVTFAHPLVAGSELRAYGGDIALSFDKRSAGSISARASTFGEVRLHDLPLTITSGRDGASRIDGTLNGGGPTLRVDASGGNVRLSGYDASL